MKPPMGACTPSTTRSLSRPERRAICALGALLVLLPSFGCDKAREGTKPAPSVSVPPDGATLVGSSSPRSTHSAWPPATPAPSSRSASSYSGTYSLSPGRLHIPDAKDYAGVKQAKDDPSKHVGEGVLSLAVDSDGRVRGTIDSGPASPALIDGTLVQGQIRGTIRRKDPRDEGLTGTLEGKVTADIVDGELALSEASAAIVRQGKLSLKKR